MQYLRVRLLMTRAATHHSGSSTIRSALYTHCVDFTRRAKQRRVPGDMTVDASRMPEHRRRFLKCLKGTDRIRLAGCRSNEPHGECNDELSHSLPPFRANS